MLCSSNKPLPGGLRACRCSTRRTAAGTALKAFWKVASQGFYEVLASTRVQVFRVRQVLAYSSRIVAAARIDRGDGSSVQYRPGTRVPAVCLRTRHEKRHCTHPLNERGMPGANLPFANAMAC